MAAYSGTMKQFDDQYGAQFTDGRAEFFETLLAAQQEWLDSSGKELHTCTATPSGAARWSPFMVGSCMAAMTRQHPRSCAN